LNSGPSPNPKASSPFGSVADVKRRKIQRVAPKRPRSSPRAAENPGLPILDLDNVRDELEAAQMVNRVFEPQPFGFSRRRAGSEESSRNALSPDRIPRRFSGSDYPRTPDVRVSPRETPSQSTRGRRTTDSSSVPPIIHSSHRNQLSKSETTSEDVKSKDLKSDDDELSRRMRELLGEDSGGLESKDRLHMFTPSESMMQKRMKRAEERKARQREAAISEAKQRRLHRRWPKKDLIAPLEPEWEARVNKVISDMASTPPDWVITKNLAGIGLPSQDFGRLLGRGQWLNDEVINAYIEWVAKAGNESIATDMKIIGEKPSTVPKIIALNSFFYEKVTAEGPGSTVRLMRRMKAPGPSLLEVDTLLVPVNNGVHWTLGVVRPVARTIEYFDSMGGGPHKFVYHMKGWLKTMLGNAYIESEWTVPVNKCAIQSNGYDCGVFVCTNALCVAFGLDTFCYTEKDMVQQRKNIAAVLMNRGFEGPFAWERNGI
jgi:sentrin-specific protease 1